MSTPRERRQMAVEQYSRLRPRLIFEAWVPTADAKAQTYPTGVFGVAQIAYGVRESLAVVAGEETGSEQGWSSESGTLYLTPAPADETPINVVWQAFHEPVPNDDDTDDTYPTLPPADIGLVDSLEEALELEALARGQLEGPIKYAVGQTVRDRSGNPQQLLSWARYLRAEVVLQLSGPIGDWG